MRSEARGKIRLIVLLLVLGLLGSIDLAVAQEDNPAVAEPTPDSMLQAIGQRMGGEPGEEVIDTGQDDGEFPSFPRLLGKLIFALLLTLGALYGALYLMRRMMGRKGSPTSPHVRVLAKTFLSTKSSVYLVEVAGQVLVVGESGGGLSLLTTIDDPQALATSGVFPQSGQPGEQPIKSGRKMEKFLGQLGQMQSQQSAQSLSDKLRESTSRAENLGQRLDSETPVRTTRKTDWPPAD